MEVGEMENELRGKVDGLMMMSETDAPFEIFNTRTTGYIQNVLQETRPDNNTVAEASFDEFYAKYATVKDFFGEDRKLFANRFREALDLLKSNVPDIKVYRVGNINVDVYIIGQSPDDGAVWTGLKTNVVETGD